MPTPAAGAAQPRKGAEALHAAAQRQGGGFLQRFAQRYNQNIYAQLGTPRPAQTPTQTPTQLFEPRQPPIRAGSSVDAEAKEVEELRSLIAGGPPSKRDTSPRSEA